GERHVIVGNRPFEQRPEIEEIFSPDASMLARNRTQHELKSTDVAASELVGKTDCTLFATEYSRDVDSVLAELLGIACAPGGEAGGGFGFGDAAERDRVVCSPAGVSVPVILPVRVVRLVGSSDLPFLGIRVSGCGEPPRRPGDDQQWVPLPLALHSDNVEE